MDSATPSAFRPFMEYVMNVDSLGREIYNNRQSRAGNAYTGGDNIPEGYKSASRMLFDITQGGIDVSPNSLYFFASNYVDGVARLGNGAYNLGLAATGEKAFNPKTDTILFDRVFNPETDNYAPDSIDNLKIVYRQTPKQGQGLLFAGHRYHSGNYPINYKSRIVINFDFTLKNN
jgi:hypothetical protein